MKSSVVRKLVGHIQTTTLTFDFDTYNDLGDYF